MSANVAEDTLANPDEDLHVSVIREIGQNESAECVVICAQLEAELIALQHRRAS